MDAPACLEDWAITLRARFNRKNRELGIKTEHAVEVFRVTAWGAVPTMEQLQSDFPTMFREASSLNQLAARLSQWSGH